MTLLKWEQLDRLPISMKEWMLFDNEERAKIKQASYGQRYPMPHIFLWLFQIILDNGAVASEKPMTYNSILSDDNAG